MKLNIFFNEFGRELNPTKIHCDNEIAIVNAIEKEFLNSVILTCIFHIKNNFKKFLNVNGRKKTRKVIEDCLTSIEGILYLNSADQTHYRFARDFLISMENSLDMYISISFNIFAVYFINLF